MYLAHLILLNFIIPSIFDEEFKSQSYSLSNCFLSLPYFIPHRPKYSPQHSALKDLFSFFNIREKVSHSYKTTGKIIILCIFNSYAFGRQMRREEAVLTVVVAKNIIFLVVTAV
jgi:hypothetical protein